MLFFIIVLDDLLEILNFVDVLTLLNCKSSLKGGYFFAKDIVLRLHLLEVGLGRVCVGVFLDWEASVFRCVLELRGGYAQNFPLLLHVVKHSTHAFPLYLHTFDL